MPQKEAERCIVLTCRLGVSANAGRISRFESRRYVMRKAAGTALMAMSREMRGRYSDSDRRKANYVRGYAGSAKGGRDG